MMRLALIPLSLFVALSGPAFAQEADRYSLERTDDGYVRLDKRTGEMSICTEQSGQLVCKMAADDRDAYDSAMDKLQTEVDALEDRVAALESAPKSTLPSESEFDQTMNYMQRFFRGFMDVVKEWDRELRGPNDPLPQRT
jgi:Mg2+ and Co2+ transporter CorA